MTVPFIPALPGVTPVVQLGVGTLSTPLTGEIGLWGAGRAPAHTRWATSTSTPSYGRWGGENPSWWDITCYIQDVVTFNGRERAGDPFEIGTATIIADNSDGWADYQYPVAPDTEAMLSVRPGRAIRVGVQFDDDDDEDPYWLFRGFVDQANAGYDPKLGASITFECIDAKGEVGRAELPEQDPPIAALETASNRIGRILDAVNWSTAPYGTKRDVDPSSIPLIATTLAGSVTDLLDRTADSSGGVVFGDLDGAVVYRNRDWQTIAADISPDGTISNLGNPATPAVLGAVVPLDDDPNGSGLYITVGAPVVEAPRLSGLYEPVGVEEIVEDPDDSGLFLLYEVDEIGMPADVCPGGWEMVNAREAIATRTQAGRNDDPMSVVTVDDVEGRSMFGLETYSKLDLETSVDVELTNLANRYARIRSWRILPRVAATTIVGSTANPQTLHLLATATPYSSLYRCIHHHGSRTVFSKLMFVVGVEHALNPDGWIARIALDSAQPFVSSGGRWGTTGYWHGPVHTTTWQPAA